MTVTTSTSSKVFIGNGVATVMPFTFRFFKDSDLKVSLIDIATGAETPLSNGVDYTVEGAGNQAGGSVTLSVALPVGKSLSVRRVLDMVQLTDLVNQGKFFPEIHENAFDYLTMLIQQTDAETVDISARSLRTPESIKEMPDTATRAGKLVAFDADGQPTVMVPAADSSLALALALANPETGSDLIGFGGGTLSDLMDSEDPAKGAAQIGRSTVAVASIVELLTAKRDTSQTVLVGAYHPGQFALANPGNALGGGAFKWAPAVARSEHNGGTVISPTAPWDGAQATLAAFLSGSGETSAAGLGCWVRVYDELKAEYFGIINDREIDSSPAFGAALRHAARNCQELVLPDFIFGVHETVVIDGADTLFATLKMRGTFCSSATALGYIPNRCGSVIYTKGNNPLEIRFNDFRNENYAIRGVGFCDQSFYPPGAPKSGAAGILIKKGRADGENNRYITGSVLEDVAFVGFANPVHIIGMVAGSVANSVDKNYIGPTTFNRVNAMNCGSAVLLTDCTMNHFWWNNSTLFGLSGYGVQVVKSAGGSGGNICVTYNNMVFEAMRGMVSTAGANLPGVGIGIRNKLVLNSCNHEYCGAFGPAGEYGVYSGNPLGFTGSTDVYINGVWTKELGFGESTLPTIDAGGQVFSTVEATFSAASEGVVRTPNTVNAYRKTVSYAVGESKATAISIGGAGGFVAELDIEIAEGALGFQKVYISGQVGGERSFTIAGSVSASVTVSVAAGAGALAVVSIANGSGFPISVALRATSQSGIELF